MYFNPTKFSWASAIPGTHSTTAASCYGKQKPTKCRGRGKAFGLAWPTAAPSGTLPICGSKDPWFEHHLQNTWAVNELFWLLLGDGNDAWPKDSS